MHHDLHLPRSKGSALVFTMLMFALCTMLTWIYLAAKVVCLFAPC